MGSIPLSKPCSKCGIVKPLTQFHTDKTKRDGRRTICKECRKSYILAEMNAQKFNNKGERLCTTCEQFKPLSEFHESKRGLHGRRPQCNKCRVEYNRGYVARNEEAVAEYQRVYKEANYEALTQRQRQKWSEKSDEINRQRRTSYGVDKQKILARNRAWRQKHKQPRKTRVSKISLATATGLALIQARRRARIKSAGGQHTPAEWEALKRHYGHTCLKCGRQEPEIKLVADHVVPVAKGGNNYISNIQPLCEHCNSVKYTTAVDYRPDGGFDTWIQARLI